MKVALVGNQNSGKTSLFNVLTGSNQKIGNWPGVTIEHKSGIIKNTEIELIDLPGVYSLSPYTAEEIISRNYVLNEKPDVILNIIDATSIERSLYLTTQLLELDIPVVIALNMNDILVKKGIKIDINKLKLELKTEIIEISALKRTGIKELIESLPLAKKETQNNIYSPEIEEAISMISYIATGKNKRFTAVKILESDAEYADKQIDEIKKVIKKIEQVEKTDVEHAIANQRYNYIVALKNRCVVQSKIKESITDKLDKVFINKWAAIPIFALIMVAIYMLAVGVVGTFTVDLVDGWFGSLKEWLAGALENAGASGWAISLVVDGVVAGVGAVCNFIPQLIILFLCLSLLETTGYMSRIVFVLDRIMRKVGLSGKSLIPFIVGSGCAVPAIMASRTIEDENEKRATIMLTPFIPCSAKLPIIALFAGYFFDKYSGLVSASLYFLAIAVILVSAIIMKKLFFKSRTENFVAELPEYKVPSVRYVLRDVFEKILAFIKRAGTIIVICSIGVWLLSSFTWKFQFIDGEVLTINDSILAGIGNALSWIFYPMLGEWSWGATVSALQGLVAKEQVVGSMEVIAGLAEGAGADVFKTSIFGFFTGASAYAFMTFNLFSAPCFGAIGAMRRELGSTKRMWQAVLFQTGLAWVLAVLVFGIGSLIGLIF